MLKTRQLIHILRFYSVLRANLSTELHNQTSSLTQHKLIINSAASAQGGTKTKLYFVFT